MAEDIRGWTPLHYACRTLAKSTSSASRMAKEDLDGIREGAEEASSNTAIRGYFGFVLHTIRSMTVHTAFFAFYFMIFFQYSIFCRISFIL